MSALKDGFPLPRSENGSVISIGDSGVIGGEVDDEPVLWVPNS
jgi:hypothetical protein